MGPMLRDAQVRLMRQKRMDGKTLEAAGAAAGVSERSARRWQKGDLPSARKRQRDWRTRPDPFAGFWESEVVPLLADDTRGVLQAKTLLEHLMEKHPQVFDEGQLRTLQRRVRDWRALHGPEKEVFFEQVHAPGREAQLDFTHATELGVTIAGVPLRHLLFEFVLSYSGWSYVDLAYGETFEALSQGIQNAVWELGGCPMIGRSDNLSAATHELKRTGGRALTRRYKDLLDHYAMRSTRIRPGKSHEDGVVEQEHFRAKSALAQALVLRGSRDFASLDEYRAFVRAVVDKRNQSVAAALAEERPHLLPLPSSRVPAYTKLKPMVRKWSTIRVGRRTYSVPSRLIGHEVEARLYPDVVEVWYRDHLIETMPRLRGADEHRIDYRHVIWSLVRKPGAFAQYRYREELFPTLAFRRAYDALVEQHGDRADVEYVRILHLAASTLEAKVASALEALLEQKAAIDYAAVQRLAAPEQLAVPPLEALQPDLPGYDTLIAERAA